MSFSQLLELNSPAFHLAHLFLLDTKKDVRLDAFFCI